MKKTSSKVIAIVLTLIMIISIVPLSIIETSATQSMSGNFSTAYTLTGNGATDIVSIALAQEGKTGSNLGYTEEWCADFASDCAKLANQSVAVPFYGGVSGLRDRIINAGGYYTTSSPQSGDICFINWNGGSSYDHVEIVYSVSGSTVYTIGGNSGSGSTLYSRVVKKHAPLPSSNVLSIVRPAYGTGSAPSLPVVTTNKSSYSLGELINISITIPSNATSSYMCIYDNNENHVFSQDVTGLTLCTANIFASGTYRIEYQSANNYGASPVAVKYFYVYDSVPLLPQVTTNKLSYSLGELININITISSDVTSSYMCIYDNNAVSYTL